MFLWWKWTSLVAMMLGLGLKGKLKALASSPILWPWPMGVWPQLQSLIWQHWLCEAWPRPHDVWPLSCTLYYRCSAMMVCFLSGWYSSGDVPCPGDRPDVTWTSRQMPEGRCCNRKKRNTKASAHDCRKTGAGATMACKSKCWR